MSTELVKLTLPEDANEVFKPQYVEELLSNIRQQATSIKADISTAKGRKEIIAVSSAVSKSKVHIDNIGKDLVSEWKAKAKVVDEQRKIVRDTLDALKEEVRAPVTTWEEEEKERKQNIRHKIEVLRGYTDHINSLDGLTQAVSHLDAMIIDEAEFAEMTEEATEVHAEAFQNAKERLAEAEKAERDRQELERLRKEKAEREAAEAEERRKQEEEERQRREEEEARRKEQERKEREAQIAKEAAEQAEYEAKQAIALAELEKAQAEQRAKEAEERAAQAEIDAKVEAERAGREESERRQADEAHRKSIRADALKVIDHIISTSEELNMAYDILDAIEDGEVPHVTLNF